MKKIYTTGFLLALFCLGGIYALSYKEKSPKYTIKQDILTFSLTTGSLFAEVAETPEERGQGLSGRRSLDENTGMLFIFQEPGIYPFWMKDMYFPIDILWLDQEWRVVDISHTVSPETYPHRFSSSVPVKYVLEVNAGFTEKNNLKVGTRLLPQ